MKICNKCLKEKEDSNYYFSITNNRYSSICKKCHSLTYYISSPNKKQCRECKKSIDISNGLNSGLKRKNGTIIYMSICKKCIKPKRNEYIRKRRKTDPHIGLYESIKTRINSSLKTDRKNTIEELGCSIKEYKIYLEKLFTSEMNWKNYGRNNYWEIDHIIPISKGGSFHYTNTRPLTIIENRQKYNKYE